MPLPLRCITCTPLLLVLAFSLSTHADEKTKSIQPLNGKNLDGWKLKGNNAAKNKWAVGYSQQNAQKPTELVYSETGDGPVQLVNKSTGGVDIYTEQKFGDCTISLELMIPKGSNSGVYVHGEYEVQILDSYGKDKIGPGDLGGLYGASAPLVNASRKPGEWQTMVIEFQAPKFDGTKKIANARFVKVTLNDQVIHENIEMKGPTPSGVTGKEDATGPLMFQGDHGPVTFRNIKITPK